jgi:ATP-dependent protease ClpP protease subunit
MGDELLSLLKAHWPDAKYFFNSVFFTAIAGSLAGAFAGAVAAQRIADKTRNKDEALKEIRATNAATMVAFGVCNSILSAKKQQINSLRETFNQHRVAARAAIAAQQAGHGQVFDFRTDFRTLQILSLPLKLLQTQVFEKLSVQGRPILLLTILDQTVRGLNASIGKRNELIETFKARSLPSSSSELLALYFGFPFQERIDQQYSDSIEAIYKQADDAIWFSATLCSDLSAHGDQISATFKKKFGKGAPRIHKPNFAKASEGNLMPSDDNYADWLSMFEPLPAPLSRIGRVWRSLRGVMPKIISLLFVVFFAAASQQTARAEPAKVTGGVACSGDEVGLTMDIDGEIDPRTVESVEKLFGQYHERQAKVRAGSKCEVRRELDFAAFGTHYGINSPGGSVPAAMAIGRIFRREHAHLIVDHNCISACILILAGAVDRHIGSTAVVGIHRPYLGTTPQQGLTTDQVKDAYARMLQDIRAYLREMDVSAQLADDMLATEPERIHVLTQAELKAYGLARVDPAEQQRRAIEKEARDVQEANQLGLDRREYTRRKSLGISSCIFNSTTGQYMTDGEMLDCRRRVLTTGH